MILSWVIGAKYNRDFITCDIPGTFLQADMDEMIGVWIPGHLLRYWHRLTQTIMKILSH